MHRLIGRKINVVKSNFPSCCRDPRSKWRASLTSPGTPPCLSLPAGILTTSLTPGGSSVPRPKVMTSNSGHTLRLTNKQLTDRQGLVSRWLRRPSRGGVQQVLGHNQQEVKCLDTIQFIIPFFTEVRLAWDCQLRSWLRGGGIPRGLHQDTVLPRLCGRAVRTQGRYSQTDKPYFWKMVPGQDMIFIQGWLHPARGASLLEHRLPQRSQQTSFRSQSLQVSNKIENTHKVPHSLDLDTSSLLWQSWIFKTHKFL